jgi:transposase InsO family protein
MPISENGEKYMFVLVDVFTGFIMLKPMKDKSASTVARALWEICSVIGFPRVLQSDNGKEFVNAIIKALVSLYGIQHRTIAAYNPRADGKVERTVRTVKKTLFKLLQGASVFWPLHLPFVQYSYNDKVQELTGATAFSLMFGRLPNDPINYKFDTMVDLPPASDEWKQHQERLVSLIFPAISTRRQDAQEKYRERMDRTRKQVIQDSLVPGTMVMIKDPLYLANPQLRPASETKYIGPYFVVRRSHFGPYHLKDEMGEPLPRPIPLDQIKVIRSRGAGDVKLSADGGVLSEISRILDHRFDKRTKQLKYLVKWKDGSKNQWVPSDGFNDTAVVTRYFQEKGIADRAMAQARANRDEDDE